MENGGDECRGIRRRISIKEDSEDRKDVQHGKDNRREQAIFNTLPFVSVRPTASALLISSWNHECDTFSLDIRTDELEAFSNIRGGLCKVFLYLCRDSRPPFNCHAHEIPCSDEVAGRALLGQMVARSDTVNAMTQLVE